MLESQPSAPKRPARTVCDLFDYQVRVRPDATAIRTADRSWTYAEFGRMTTRLAHRLRRHVSGSGTVVGLLAPRGVAALTGIVATLRSGAACLPLHPADPPRRNQEILADAGADHVLVASPADWLRGAQLIDDPSLDDENDDPATLHGPRPLDLAYAITTSGSTGRPKVVGVPHEGIFNLMVASMEDLDLIRDDDVMLWTTSPTVDSTMHDVLMPLCSGGAVAIAEGGDLPASRMLTATRAMGVTALEIPAAVLGPYGRSLLPRLAKAGVRLVITGGSQLDGPGLADAEPLVVQNGYGPTEASVAATWYKCVRSTPPRAPIGRPIRGVRTYILDEDLNPAPQGAEGQLYIAGRGLARGYLGLPARTAAGFLPDPFAENPGERMYATGDRVRLQPDGDFVYLGRVDDQFKINGFRVESGEVEHSLRECPGVTDSAVVLREDLPGGAGIVAFLVGAGAPDEMITDRLRDLLPAHMIPRFYVWLDEMPLNRPGKIDRTALATVAVVDPAGWHGTKLADGVMTLSRDATRTELRDEGRTARRARIAIVGGKPKLVRKAGELGLDVVYIQHPDEYDRTHWHYVDQALLVDYADTVRLLPLVQSLHEAYPFETVVSLSELGLLPAAKIDHMLGLGGNSLATVEMLLDKWRMRQHLNASGISPVAAAVGETEQDLRKFAQAHGLPMVVKPTREAGSIGIFAVRDEAEFASVTARFRALNDQFDKKDLAGDLDHFLMEEYLDGPEISVETLSFNGRHVLIGATDKLCGGPGFVEIGHSVPSRQPAPLLREVEEVVMTFLDAVGLRHGPGHTEVKLTSRGPRIIESHNRVGGDRINELHELAYDVDMERYALGSRSGLIEPLQQSPGRLAGAAIRFLAPPPGRVIEVTGAEIVTADPALVELQISVKPGDEVPPLTWSEDRVGHVIARGETAYEAIANCERLLTAIRIHTEPVT
jgi:amino acid adenylation domain-containing protein